MAETNPNAALGSHQETLEEKLEIKEEKKIKENHGAIWSVISRPGNRGRTYCLAKCCVTVFEKRKFEKHAASESLQPLIYQHPEKEIVTLGKILGKRDDWNATILSEKLSEYEDGDSENMPATFNLPHSVGDMNRKFLVLQASLNTTQKELADYKKEADSTMRRLEEQINALSDSNEKVKKDLEVEIQHRLVAVETSKKVVLASESFCENCKSALSQARIPNSRGPLSK